ncbi:MAG TPA: alpha/beta fold hydrolase [Steroidobacteraceae bacterium]|nr:alpha/beta fold hydrolase [Steroidobacteraceae bacterium]
MSAGQFGMIRERHPTLRAASVSRKLCTWHVVALAVLAVLPGQGSATVPADLPAAIYSDPPADPAHPASGRGVQFRSHGSLLNAQLYQPPGDGPHPTVILLHGLPGNEQNLDLAQVMRRAGWTVITFHFRGSWGSGGRFTLSNCIEDVEELLRQLGQADLARAWGVDPKHLVLIGHSFGGDVAALVASRTPGLLGTVLLAPWDVSSTRKAWQKVPTEQRDRLATKFFFDANGRLAGVDPQSLGEDVMRSSARLDLARCAPALTGHTMLVVTALHDDPGDQALELLAELRARNAPHLSSIQLDSDHGFNDHRVALEAVVLRWLGTLDGAPAAL